MVTDNSVLDYYTHTKIGLNYQSSIEICEEPYTVTRDESTTEAKSENVIYTVHNVLVRVREYNYTGLCVFTNPPKMKIVIMFNVLYLTAELFINEP